MHSEYPKFKYHKTKAPVIVHQKDQEEKLGKDWQNSPADFGVETHPQAEAAPVWDIDTALAAEKRKKVEVKK